MGTVQVWPDKSPSKCSQNIRGTSTEVGLKDIQPIGNNGIHTAIHVADR